MITPAHANGQATPPGDVDPGLAALVGGVARVGGWTINVLEDRWEFAPPGGSAAAQLGVAGGLNWSRSSLGAFCESVTGAATIHAEPARPIRSVRQLSRQLLNHYHVEDGRVYLGGCSLDPVPLLRFSYLTDRHAVCHQWRGPTGAALDDRLIDSLQLDELQVLPAPLRPWSDSDARESQPSEQDAVLTVVWVAYARGQIVASVGDHLTVIPFAGWARQLASGGATPPPYTCPLTGASSYRLAMTDDGAVTCVEAIGECDVSGERRLVSDLVSCDATGQLVSVDSTVVCQVSDQRVQADKSQVCQLCGQRVSPRVMSRGYCLVCQSLAPADANDKRLQAVLQQRPDLQSLRKWRVAESPKLTILVASKWTQRRALVLDRESGSIVRELSAPLWSRHWRLVGESPND